MPFSGLPGAPARPHVGALGQLPPLAGHPLVRSGPLPFNAATAGLTSTTVSAAPRRHTGRGLRPALGGLAVVAVAGALAATGTGGTTHAGTPAAAAAAAPAAVAPAGAVASATSVEPAAFVLPAGPASAPTVVRAAQTAHVATSSKRQVVHTASYVTRTDKSHIKAMSAGLSRLRSCESGGYYGMDSGNGYYGAYQFDLRTWEGLGLRGLPSNASRQLQDAAVVRLARERGWGPWPVCSYVAGLR